MRLAEKYRELGTLEGLEPNKANLLRWVKALESGAFQQGIGKNCYYNGDDGVRYCCLGVAEVVAENNGCEYRIEFPRDRYAMSADTALWLGLDDDNPVLNPDADEPRSASQLNDSGNFDFMQIAALIRAKYDLGERSQLG